MLNIAICDFLSFVVNLDCFNVKIGVAIIYFEWLSSCSSACICNRWWKLGLSIREKQLNSIDIEVFIELNCFVNETLISLNLQVDSFISFYHVFLRLGYFRCVFFLCFRFQNIGHVWGRCRWDTVLFCK